MRERPVLALITCRPEFDMPWSGLSNVTTITVGRLDRGSAQALIHSLAGGKALPTAVIDQIAVNTDGVPLFIEELTKSVLESELLVEEDERFRLHGARPLVTIPATLHDSLMARLDRLAPVREVAQVAATIGREFSYALLRAVAGSDPATLDAALARLEEAELLFCISAPPNARYRFKHSLIQNAAYETLLKSRRQVLHGRIADVLCDRFPQVAEAEPEVIAHHLSRAGMVAAAVNWWRKAGVRALERSAHVEAIAHYGHAVAAAGAMGEPALSPMDRLRLQVAYCQALIAAHSHGAPVTVAAFARARELAAEVAGSPEGFAVSYGLWAGCHVRGDLAGARAFAATLVGEAETHTDFSERALAHRAFGTTSWAAGELATARSALEQAIQAHDFERDRVRGACRLFGLDPTVGTSMQLAIVLWMQGDEAAAERLAEAGGELAARSNHVPTIAYAHGWTCLLATLCRDAYRVTMHAQTLVALCRDHALPVWVELGTMFLGWAQAYDETAVGPQIGLPEMRRVIAAFREQGFRLYLTFFPAVLAETEWAAGNADAARALLDQAIADSEASGQQWYLAELHRLRAGMTHGLGDGSAARRELERAISIAARQEARQFAERAVRDLAAASGRGAIVPPP